MTNPNSKFVKNLLIQNKPLLKQFVRCAIDSARTVAESCAHRSLLVEIPIPSVDRDFTADVEIHLGEFQQFERLKKSFNDDLVEFEVRRMSSALEPGSRLRCNVEGDEYYDIPQAIFGFVGTYGAICIRRHSRLDCLIVQFS